MTSRGPIADRLALLYEQWDTFATDRDARVLRWLIRDDERRMLEALLALEDDEAGQRGQWVLLERSGWSPSAARRLARRIQSVAKPSSDLYAFKPGSDFGPAVLMFGSS